MNGEHLLNIANAGLLLNQRETDNKEYDRKELLNILLDIENILDTGRGLLFDSHDVKLEVVNKMDQVRKRIRDILDGMDKEEAREFLYARGEMIKTQFSV